ncbi:MAG: hypothetical protein F6K19_19345 [Cyanothece sp. SIO1E1]|nr:hypothetical protein [Cyanothece sp. SIO1E1]
MNTHTHMMPMSMPGQGSHATSHPNQHTTHQSGSPTERHSHAGQASPDAATNQAKQNEHAALFADDGVMATLYGLNGNALEAAAGTGAKVITAISSGAWSNPATWGGIVPEKNALVHIPQGIAVDYDVASDVPLFSIFVEGGLQFATDQNTKLVVDTLVTAGNSHLSIGTEDTPVQANVSTDIIIRKDGQPADKRNWDPGQFTKGIITHGVVDIFGAGKTSKLALAQDVRAGDTTLVLRGSAAGWVKGDTIVLAGTYLNTNGSNADNTRFHDEELIIDSVSDNGDGTTTLTFTNLDTNGNALRFDHTRPQSPNGNFDRTQLNIYAANLSRNITIASEAGEASMPENGGDVHTRGHVMLMHNPDVQVHNTAFVDLGRSDKMQLADSKTNAKGRYGLHFHRTGAEDITQKPAEAEGVVVKGSPGWGVVHHQSHLNVIDSVVYETVGSGLVAEAGDEIGIWRDNFVLKVTSTEIDAGDSNESDVNFWVPTNRLGNNTLDLESSTSEFDFGRSEAYWVQGAGQIKIEDNVAASAPTAITFFADSWELANKDAKTVAVSNLRIREEDGTIAETDAYKALRAAGYDDTDRIAVGGVPPKDVKGFEASNVGNGLVFWLVQRNPDGDADLNPIYTTGDYQGPLEHDAVATVSDTTVWNVNKNGVLLAHSSQVEFDNIVAIAADDVSFNETPGSLSDVTGVAFGTTADTTSTAFSNARSFGFEKEFSDRVGIGPNPEDRIDGTDGQDILTADKKEMGDVYFSGGNGDDRLKGGGGNDILIGGAGNDVITVKANNRTSVIRELRVDRDLAIGGDGDDIFTAQSADAWVSLFYGGAGYDQLQIMGGDGYGLVLNRFSAYEQSIEAIAQQEGDPFWSFSGTETADHIDLRGAVIYATTRFDAFDGDDIYFGTYQSEAISGDEGNDFLSGEGGADRIDGGAGNDILRGGVGKNWLTGGEGTDIFQVGDNGVQLVRDFHVSSDRIAIAVPNVDDVGDLRATVITWNPGNSKGNFESGRKNEEALFITWGNHEAPQSGDFFNPNDFIGTGIILQGVTDFSVLRDRIDFGDTLYAPTPDFTHPVAVPEIPDWVNPKDLAPGIDPRRLVNEGVQPDTAAALEIDTSSLSRAEVGETRTGGSLVSPGRRANAKTGKGGYVVGNEANNRLFGTHMNDVLEGGDGDDFLDLDFGFDVAIGGAGDDLIRSGSRNNAQKKNSTIEVDRPDRFFGGAGYDAVKAGSGGTLGLDRFSRGETSIEALWASRIRGSDNNHKGEYAPDNILDFRGVMIHNFANLSVGGTGVGVEINGRDGNDIIYGNHNDNEIYGDAGTDFLAGEEGNDLLDGGSGSDILRGGEGVNSVTGGAESDVFQVGSVGEVTTIEDFQVGVDRIEIAAAVIATNRIVEPGARPRFPDIVFTELVLENGSTVKLKGVDPDTLGANDIVQVTGFADPIPSTDWAAVDDPSLRGDRIMRSHGDETPANSHPHDHDNTPDITHDDMPDTGNDSASDGVSDDMPDTGNDESGEGASGEIPDMTDDADDEISDDAPDMGDSDSGNGASGETLDIPDMPDMGNDDSGTGSPSDIPTNGPSDSTGIAVLDSAGATFNGTSDAMVVDHQAAFEAESGSFSFRFKPTDTNGFQALLSKDSSGYDDGGHLTVLMEGDSLRLRAQTEDKSFNIRGGKVSAGDWHELEVSWGPEGLQLSLDGAEVGRAEGFTDHLVNNLEPVVLGANQWGSSNQAADRLRHFFSGEIAEVKFMGDTASADMSAGEQDDMAQGGCPVTGEAVCHCGDKDEHEHEHDSQGEATANPADDMSHAHADDMAAGGCPVTGEAICHCDDKDDQDNEQEGEADSSSPEPTDLDVVGEGHATADPADDMGNSPVEESLSDGNDVFNGDKTSQIIRGLGGRDRIRAKAGDDLVYGDAGNDALWGNRGHDTLQGGQGRDTLGGGQGDDMLIGVDASQMAAGRGEIDLLVGHKGADRFVIGDSTQVFYNDGLAGNVGSQDYAVIRDFNRAAGDVIQLHGQAEDYTLGSAPKGTRKGTGIFLNTTDKAGLVAVVRNGTGLDLESEDFQFV